MKITVLPNVVPTTGAPFHPSATHRDALGMPVSYCEGFSFHPTPCCGAAASVGDYGFYCKACYGEVDPAYGNVPHDPITELGGPQNAA